MLAAAKISVNILNDNFQEEAKLGSNLLEKYNSEHFLLGHFQFQSYCQK